MNSQQRQLLESAIQLLHRIIGLDDAIEDFATVRRGRFRIEGDDRRELAFLTNAKTPPPERAGAIILDGGELGSSPGKNRGIINFTEKELLSMPKEKRNYFRVHGIRVHYRKKPNGVYEIRCTINKTQYYGAAKDLKLAKARFLEDLKREPTEQRSGRSATSALPLDVAAYSLHFLEVFKKPNVGADTLKNYENVNRIHIIGKLGADTLIRDVTASDCQRILRDLREEGKKRTAEEVCNLLSWIFDAAVSDKLISASPMQSVKIPKHRRTVGKCLPLPLMQELLAAPTCRYDYLIWLVAYTGMRPVEIKSAVFEGDFVTIKNGKTDVNDEPTFRRIPLHPALRPHVAELKRWLQVNTDEVSRHFRKKIKGYRFYDLRHTFTTYLQESGADKRWIDYVTNHVAAQNVTDSVYTHWTDKFHLSQIEKLEY